MLCVFGWFACTLRVRSASRCGNLTEQLYEYVWVHASVRACVRINVYVFFTEIGWRLSADLRVVWNRDIVRLLLVALGTYVYGNGCIIRILTATFHTRFQLNLLLFAHTHIVSIRHFFFSSFNCQLMFSSSFNSFFRLSYAYIIKWFKYGDVYYALANVRAVKSAQDDNFSIFNVKERG